MARYDGMDMIIQQLQGRLAPEDHAPDRVRPQPLSLQQPIGEKRPYEASVESLVHMQREAERLGALLSEEASKAMTRREQERLLVLLRMLLQDLTEAQHALQLVTLHE